MSTLAFTLMFAVWLMFGVLGVPIQKEFGLTDVELSWISAVAVLNGSMWRLPAGMLTDRIGGRKVTIALLVLTAIPCYFLTQVGSYGSLLILAFLVGFAGNLFSVGIAWNSAWTPRERQGLRARGLRCWQRWRFGHEAARGALSGPGGGWSEPPPRGSSRADGESFLRSTPSRSSSSQS
jgi:nitrate/nitrite transporter NarK